MDKNQLITSYFAEWIDIYKRDAVRPVTLQKYETSLKRLSQIAPQLMLVNLNRRSYQQILNVYAQNHERQTTLDFHHQLRAAIVDAVDEGFLAHDPTRRAVIKGTIQRQHAVKFLNLRQLKQLLATLNISDDALWDCFIYVVLKTGLRFSEALALTHEDFSFDKQIIKISQTWDYKSSIGGFAPTKNMSSRRTITLDKHTSELIRQLAVDIPAQQPIFIEPGHRVFNESANSRLRQLCTLADIPTITIHGLRHTHASVLLYAGVSVASVARRLGHANITTTQKTYLHIIEELEAQDNEKVIHCLEMLG